MSKRTKLVGEFKLNAVDNLATEKLIDRDSSYRNTSGVPAWQLMSVDEILHGVIYKSARARVTKDLNKQLDDITDAINYLRFAGVHVMEEIERGKKVHPTKVNQLRFGENTST